MIGPVPPPVTGQSLACQVLLDSLRPLHDVIVVNLSRVGLDSGSTTLGRVREVIDIARAVWRRRSLADVIYLTVAESRVGNAKDLLLYLLCLGRLEHVLIHLHGGAGMRRLLSSSGFDPLRPLHRAFLRRLGGVIVLGPRHRDIFAGTVGPERLHEVPNFAADDIFLPIERLRAKFAIGGPLRVLYLSNLLPGKGYLELLGAIRALPEHTRRGFRFDFAGGFESDQDRQAFLDRIRDIPEVCYHGVVHGEAKRTLFQQSHIFVLPTYYPYEGQPISILEAYAAGCAVITTDHSGIMDVFDPAVSGYVVEPRSEASLVRALEQALIERHLLMDKAEANCRRASEEFRTSVYSARLHGLLSAVARGSKEAE